MYVTVKSLWFIQLYVYRISCNTSFISTYGGFLKWGYPQIIHFNRILIRLSIINHPAIGVPPFMETSISNHIWLVVSTHLKNMSSSVGMMTFPTEWKVIKFMFQTTNQLGTSMIIGMIIIHTKYIKRLFRLRPLVWWFDPNPHLIAAGRTRRIPDITLETEPAMRIRKWLLLFVHFSRP